MKPQLVTFLIKCPDQKGIIATLTNFFFKEGFNIISSQQYTNSIDRTFFMRIRLTSDVSVHLSKSELEQRFSVLSETYQISWQVDYGRKKQNVAIMVSHTSHNLYDLLHRYKEGKLNCVVKMVVGNHLKLKPVADMFGVPFYHKPIGDKTKEQQEKEVMELFDAEGIDLVVMARYMQILSKEFVHHFKNRIINIHHSFLPAFQGANPYKRAYERGVKLIGATAHYATEDLDEGPIIEQGVERVSHESSPTSLKNIGADIETLVLAKAVNCHLNNQIIIDGNKAIVFPEAGE